MGFTARPVARERIFAWLAEGAREVSWALCSLPRDRWTQPPPRQLGTWPALRHARHLALRERHLTLPAVRYALDQSTPDPPSPNTFERADAAWDAGSAADDADALMRGLGETRYELLQRLQSAPDAAWQAPLPLDTPPEPSTAPLRLDTLLLRARQHELEHLADIWRVALYWDRNRDECVPNTPATGFPLHAADRLEESH